MRRFPKSCSITLLAGFAFFGTPRRGFADYSNDFAAMMFAALVCGLISSILSFLVWLACRNAQSGFRSFRFAFGALIAVTQILVGVLCLLFLDNAPNEFSWILLVFFGTGGFSSWTVYNALRGGEASSTSKQDVPPEIW
jgi:hypothetical protein